MKMYKCKHCGSVINSYKDIKDNICVECPFCGMEVDENIVVELYMIQKESEENEEMV